VGPFETGRRTLKMSVCRGRSEVIGVRSRRRFLTLAVQKRKKSKRDENDFSQIDSNRKRS
jgi:hypothetical protein